MFGDAEVLQQVRGIFNYDKWTRGSLLIVAAEAARSDGAISREEEAQLIALSRALEVRYVR